MPLWRGVRHVVIDEVHALAPTKRGADLAVSLERLAKHSQCDPVRIALSATCRSDSQAVRFVAGATRTCQVIHAPPPQGTPPIEISVESLIKPGEAPHRGLSYRRLLKHLRRCIIGNRTTVVFANTRAFAEKLTHDLRHEPTLAAEPEQAIVAHHSSLDAERRREIESALRDGKVRAVITSTSLELGVDIGTADLTIQVGQPGGVARCLQRVGRAGHRRCAVSRGLLLAATHAELASAAITARAARAGRVEPLSVVHSPLDVVCQQLVGMACAGEQDANAAFDLIRNAGPMAALMRSDFDACLDFLAGKLAAPAGALEPEAGAPPTLDLAPTLETRRPVWASQSSRRPLVLEQRGDHQLGRDRSSHGSGRRSRHARGGIRRETRSRRSLYSRWPRLRIPAPRGPDPLRPILIG